MECEDINKTEYLNIITGLDAKFREILLLSINSARDSGVDLNEAVVGEHIN